MSDRPNPARELVDTYPHHLLHIHPEEGSEQ
jgi:hypothetical protein